jgi:hypothetical protein
MLRVVSIIFLSILLIGVASASVSYDGTRNIYGVYLCNASSSCSYITQTVLSAGTNYTIVRQNITVGEWVEFGLSQRTWHVLNFTVTAPIIGDNVRFDWQYYDQNSDIFRNISLFDSSTNTNMNTTGQVLINFSSHSTPYFYGRNVNSGQGNGDYAMTIRALLVSGENITQGVNTSGRPNVKDDTISIWGEDIDIPTLMNSLDNESRRICFENVGDAYICYCNINLNRNTTTGKGTRLRVNNSIYFQLGNATNTRDIYSCMEAGVQADCKGNVSFEIGMFDSAYNTSSQGSMWKWYSHSTPTASFSATYNYNFWFMNISVYQSLIAKGGAAAAGERSGIVRTSPNKFTVIDSIITNFVPTNGAGGNWYYESNGALGEFRDSIISGFSRTGIGVFLYSPTYTFDNIKFTTMSYIQHGITSTVNNVKFNNVQYRVSNTWARPSCNNCQGINSISLSGSQTLTQYFDMSINATDKNGNYLSDYNVSITDSLNRTVQSNSVYTGKVMVAVKNTTSTGTTNLNPMTVIVRKEGYANTKLIFNLDYNNKEVSVPLGVYPFEVNGTIVINKANGEGIKIYEN